jgi:hypothetical protein
LSNLIGQFLCTALADRSKEQPSLQSDEEVKSLKAEIARLQAQLKYEQLRADAYDEMINVAESMFKIPVRKKVGAKR